MDWPFIFFSIEAQVRVCQGVIIDRSLALSETVDTLSLLPRVEGGGVEGEGERDVSTFYCFDKMPGRGELTRKEERFILFSLRTQAQLSWGWWWDSRVTLRLSREAERHECWCSTRFIVFIQRLPTPSPSVWVFPPHLT